MRRTCRSEMECAFAMEVVSSRRKRAAVIVAWEAGERVLGLGMVMMVEGQREVEEVGVGSGDCGKAAVE